MSGAETMKGLLDTSYKEFVKFSLPLYHGPTVRVKVGAIDYQISKALLCQKSTYFAAMFNGKFKEGEDQSAVLEELEGVVSIQSFELFLQWLYLGRTIFDEEAPQDRISAIIEFARLADMLGISVAESQMVEHIRATILNNPPPKIYYNRDPDSNVYHITSRHIYAATRLPKGHLVRLLFARAAVEGYVNSENFKFLKETREIPEFAADLLEEWRFSLKTLANQYDATFKDPFTEERQRFSPYP